MRPGRLHYAWVVVAVGFLALVMAAGFRSVAGIVLVPLHEEFCWSHGTISAAVFVNLVCYGLGAPFAAALAERFGLRQIISLALVTIAASSLLLVRASEPWQLYLLLGVVNGFATGAIGVPIGAMIANRWFVARRGLVTGMLTASNASGSLVFLPILAWVSGFDWRWAAAVVAATAVFVVLPPVALLMRNRPSDVGTTPFGAPEGWVAPPPAPGGASAALEGLAIAAGSGVFGLLSSTFFVCGATTNGLISTHLIPAAHDHGMTQVTAASLLALIGVFDIAGTLGSGWLTDRYDARYLLLLYYGFRGLALMALPLAFGTEHAALVAFAGGDVLDWAAPWPPLSALTTKEFGLQRAGVVFAWVFAAHQLGAATIAWGAGLRWEGHTS